MSGILIVSKQRAGANLLRNMINLSSGVRNIGEVMHLSTQGWPGNFFDWYRECYGESGDALPLVRNKDWTETTLLEYLQDIESRFPLFVLDVKYNSFHALAPTWYNIVDPPTLLQLAIQRKYLIVHLTRTDRLAHVASQLLSERSGLYMTNSDLDRKKLKSISIDPAIARIMIDHYEKEIALFRWWLRHYDNTIEVDYETITHSSGTEREDVLRNISSRVEAPFNGYFEPALKRIVPDWRVYVDNASELEDASLARAMEDDHA